MTGAADAPAALEPSPPPPAAREDALLRRLERRMRWLTPTAALAGWIVPGGGWRFSMAVLGGVALIAFSYWALRRAVSRLTRSTGTPVGRPKGFGGFLFRHALLGLFAYVMIARLRLPPVGLVCGASLVVIAAAAELTRPPR